MIDVFVDPALDHTLDVAEVAHHIAIVERARADFDLGNRVVAVWMLANAIVIEQSMAVAELDFLGHGVHGRMVQEGLRAVPDDCRARGREGPLWRLGVHLCLAWSL